MSEYAGHREVFIQGYISAVRDARKEIAEISRLKKPFDLSTVDKVVKDLIKNLTKDVSDETERQSEVV